VVVSDYQLSLAIGKEGQNARLAARLTGWRIDVKSETQLVDEEAAYGEQWAEGEWVENEAGEMLWQPAEGGEAVSAAEWSRVASGSAVPRGEKAGEAGEKAGAADKIGSAGTAEARDEVSPDEVEKASDQAPGPEKASEVQPANDGRQVESQAHTEGQGVG
jgi:N utilization substance protein A